MAQPRKYFFFDYDGTLAIPRTHTIPESTRAAVTALEEAGHFVALATGRLQCNARDYIESMGITNLVADGGYSVTLGGKLVWMRGLPLGPAKECLRRLDAAGILWAVSTVNELVRYTPHSNFDQVAGDYYVPTEYREGLTVDSLETIYKIYIPVKQEDQDAFIAEGYLEGVPWARYNSDTVFVEPTSKAVGIRRMMEEIGAADQLQHVVVFGDGTNDESMFLPEWTSVAMGNAVPQLKEKATYVTTSCTEDGIANACRHFGWI